MLIPAPLVSKSVVQLPVDKRRCLGIHSMSITVLTQDVVLTSIQRRLNVMDVRKTLKQRCVLTGNVFNFRSAEGAHIDIVCSL